MFNKSIIPVVILFLITCAVILLGRSYLQQKGIDWEVLMGGNIFIYLITIISIHLLRKGLDAANTHAFLRNAYGGILLKLMACAGAAFVYILAAGSHLNKAALLICMGLYLVYSIAEITVIMKQSKQKKNVEN